MKTNDTIKHCHYVSIYFHSPSFDGIQEVLILWNRVATKLLIVYCEAILPQPHHHLYLRLSQQMYQYRTRRLTEVNKFFIEDTKRF